MAIFATDSYITKLQKRQNALRTELFTVCRRMSQKTKEQRLVISKRQNTLTKNMLDISKRIQHVRDAEASSEEVKLAVECLCYAFSSFDR